MFFQRILNVYKLKGCVSITFIFLRDWFLPDGRISGLQQSWGSTGFMFFFQIPGILIVLCSFNLSLISRIVFRFRNVWNTPLPSAWRRVRWPKCSHYSSASSSPRYAPQADSQIMRFSGKMENCVTPSG